MRRLLLVASFLGSCASPPARINVEALWDPRPEPFLGQVFIEASVAAGGATASRWSRRPFREDVALSLDEVPNGPGRVLTIDVLDGSWSNSRVLYRAVSNPFEVSPGAESTVTVTFRAVDEPTEPGPATPLVDRIQHRRLPWGDIDGDVAPLEFVVGDAGALGGGQTAVVFSGAEVWTAAELGRVRAEGDGSFMVALTEPSPFGPLRRLFVAALDEENALSDASDSSGLQAIAVKRLEVLARPTPEADFSIEALTRTQRTRKQAASASTTVRDDDLALLLHSDQGVVAAKAKAHFEQVEARFGAPPLEHAALAADPNTGDLLLLGGSTSRVVIASTQFVRNKEWNEWVPLSPRPDARIDHGLAFDSQHDEFVLFGGVDGATRHQDTWVFKSGEWEEKVVVGPTPGPRRRHVLVHHAEAGVTLLYGGLVGAAWTDDVWTWDGAKWTSRTEGVRPPRLFDPLATYDGGRGQLVLLGTNDRGEQELWEWDAWGWRDVTTAATPAAPRRATFTYSPEIGASVLIDGTPPSGSSPIAQVLHYDGSNWSQFAPPPDHSRPDRRAGHVATFGYLENGIFMFGGRIGPNELDEHSWLLTSDHWRRAASDLTSVTMGDVVSGTYMDDSARISMLFKPESSGTITYVRTGRAWGRFRTQEGLPIGGASAYDPNYFGSFYYGGERSTGTSTGTLFRGSVSPTWNHVTTSNLQPDRRISAAMTYDETRGHPILFGGSTTDDRVWSLREFEWRFESARGMIPSRRSGHRMIYDRAHQNLFLYGGESVNGELLEDAYTLTGLDWRQLTTQTAVHPGRRKLHGLFQDPGRQRIVLDGGLGSAGLLADVLEWDGTEWREIDLETPKPDPRADHLALYDPVCECAVLFGGQRSGAIVSSETWEYFHRKDLRPAIAIDARSPTFDIPIADLSDVIIDAVVGGTGYGVSASSPPEIAGARLLAWNRRTSQWVVMAENQAAAPAPAALQTELPAPLADYVHPARGVSLRFEPVGADGSSATQARVALDQLAISWRHSLDVAAENTCGDGRILGDERCDDGNEEMGDGCGSSCIVERFWNCAGTPSACVQCGDGAREGPEACDDGNVVNGDGCSEVCRVGS